jgi:hypothetical protein
MTPERAAARASVLPVARAARPAALEVAPPAASAASAARRAPVVSRQAARRERAASRRAARRAPVVSRREALPERSAARQAQGDRRARVAQPVPAARGESVARQVQEVQRALADPRARAVRRPEERAARAAPRVLAEPVAREAPAVARRCRRVKPRTDCSLECKPSACRRPRRASFATRAWWPRARRSARRVAEPASACSTIRDRAATDLPARATRASIRPRSAFARGGAAPARRARRLRAAPAEAASDALNQGNFSHSGGPCASRGR